MTINKMVEVRINLTPDDIVDYLKNADAQAQSAILRKLSKIHYNEVGRFLMQLQYVADDIKDSYDHDIQNNIKHMIRDLYGYICEVENGNN